MPGLRLTLQQASVLWAVDHVTAECVLDRLESIGFLAVRYPRLKTRGFTHPR
jgi:hypothetical protein